jgi:alpha-N-arabinofuranosidase
MPGESPMANLRRANGRQEPWPIKFWGVGNENWGCGGNMRPQYYADLYRQYQSYCRHFTPNQKLYKVACGLTNEWNDILMREAGGMMDGLSVHYYTVPGTWQHKGSATDFTIDEWRVTMQKAANIDGFIRQTAGIMDRYDPKKRVGIVMDEWGTWFDVEPGTNPGFLYQQNTIRDALVAGLSLNVFNNHADRVHVANIAQTVNVLQAMILTEGPKMLLTPTYHVFEMYKVHQDATLLPSILECDQYAGPLAAQEQPAWAAQYATPADPIAQLSASASRDASGSVHISLCNLHHGDAAELTCDMRGVGVTTATARVLTAPTTNAMNTFEQPKAVGPSAFHDFKLRNTGVTVTLPPRSVVVMELR